MIDPPDFVRELEEKTPPLLWIPVVGEKINNFVADQLKNNEELTEEQLGRVVTEARTILGRCVDPKSSSSTSTGLVVGRVQSGKTLSFTSVAALAHDNGFGLIIIIAGTKNNLINQTLERLFFDLNIKHDEVTDWVTFSNPSEQNNGNSLKKHLSAWDYDYFVKKRVCLVTVLKNSTRLKNLCELLGKIDLQKVPTLIIDDEADQAGLNNFSAKNRLSKLDQKSSNYSWLLELRKVLPFHSYVQYTATPQANLLISISDKLSPEFAELITPGDGYVGGKDFFYENSEYIKIIPPATNIGGKQTMPKSLVEAFSVFIYGSAYHEQSGSNSIRSMMIHPAQNTGPQKQYLSWIEDLLHEWSNGLLDLTRKEKILEIISGGRNVLQETFEEELPNVHEIFQSILNVVHFLKIQEVNATPTGRADFNWGQAKYWVLVGGAKLDRGFTVKNLTVTYMPRPLGDGNADSVQQRARFLGYKAKYKKYCRIYVERPVKNAFDNYVLHEEEIHRALVEERGYPLANWRRKFLLDAALNPTRSSVIGLDLSRVDLDGWGHPNDLAINEDKSISNYHTVFEFISALPPKLDPVETYPEMFIDKRGLLSDKHWLFENIPINFVKSKLLEKMQFHSSDDDLLIQSLLAQLSRIESVNKNEMFDIFVMRGLKSTRRSYSDKKRIQPFQGKSPNTNDLTKLIYGGDKSFFFAERLCLQIHLFEIYENKNSQTPLIDKCPWICFYIPNSLRGSVLIDKNG